MIPVLLTVENLQESNAQYKFNDGKTFFKLKDAVAVKQALSYAIFGNATLFQGKVELSFKHNEQNYIIERDFATNKAKLTADSDINTDIEQINKFMSSVVGYSANQWEEFVVADKEASLDQSTNDITMFLKDSFASLGIDDDVLKQADNSMRKKIDALKAQIFVLSDMQKTSGQELSDKIAATKEDIADIKAELARLNDFIVEARSLAKVKEEYEKVIYQLGLERDKDEDLMELISKLNQSERMEKAIFLYEKNNEIMQENESLQKEIESLTAQLAVMEKDITRGEKAQAEKEKTFILLNEQIKELNKVLDTTLVGNATSGDIDGAVLALAQTYYASSNQAIIDLQAKLDSESIKLLAVENEIAEKRQEFDNKRYTCRERADIREGASIESIVTIKKARLEQLLSQENSLQQTITEFRLKKQDNQNIVNNSEKEETALLQQGGYDNFFASYNELEINKQKLYKGQILSASLLGELKAIDHKIFDNEQARLSYIEDITALNNAKSVLANYVEKCEDKLAKQKDKLVAFLVKQEYCKSVDNLEYGGECPVCKNMLLDKVDMSIENTRASANIKRQQEEIDKTNIILQEYNQKLEKINIRLGSLQAKEATSANYIESLKTTKDAKISQREKIFSDCGVTSHEQLTAKVNEAIDSILDFSERLAKINQAAGIKHFAQDSNKLLDKNIDIMQNQELPAVKSEIAEINAQLQRFEAVYEEISKRLQGKLASEQLKDISDVERKEDEILRQVKALTTQKQDLEQSCKKLSAEIAKLESRKAGVTVDGKPYDYDQLCIMLTGRKYQEILAEIRKTEQQKQTAQDEFVAIKRLLSEKKQAFSQLANQTDVLLKKAEVNKTYIDNLNLNSNFDPSELKNKNLATLKKSILSEEDKQAMQAVLDEHSLRMGSLTYQCDALGARLESGRVLIENYKYNTDSYKELQEQLFQKEDLMNNLVKELAIADTLNCKLNALQIVKSEKERALLTINSSTTEGLAHEFVAYMNNMLRLLGQKYHLKEDGKSLAINFVDRKGITKVAEKLDEASKTALAISAIDAIGTIVSNVFDVAVLPRIVSVKASLFNEAERQVLIEEASKKGILLLLNK